MSKAEDTEYSRDLAKLLYVQGAHIKAERLTDKLLAEHPSDVVCLTLKARLLAQRGQVRMALLTVESGLEIDSGNKDLLELKGMLQVELGSVEDAEQTALTLAQIDSASPQALRLCSQVLRKLEQYHQAFILAEKATRVASDSGLAFYLAGVLALEIKQYEIATEYLLESLRLQPNRVATEMNLVIALDKLGKFAESHSLLEASIERRGGSASEADHLMWGQHWLARGNITKAKESLLSVLSINPESAVAHSILGIALQLAGAVDQAISSYLLAVLQSPGDANTHMNLALAYLLLDNYQNGWAEYEWRRAVMDIDPPSLSEFRELTSAKHLPQTLLITSEQGIGDIIHFARYAQFFRARGVQVFLYTHSKLVSLLKESGLFDGVSSDLASLTEKSHDIAWIPIMSIPRLLGVRRDNPLFITPYLSIPSGSVQQWSEIMACDNGGLKIGIHWQGNPESERSTLLGRSMPLQRFEPLIRSTKNINWISLQKGHGSEQMNAFSCKQEFASYQHVIDDAWDFIDTGAIIMNCNLVITTDSAIAHLAGALGRPVWLMLTAVPEWRWGLEGDWSSWYPSMRLFRQRSFGEWEELMRRVCSELAAYIHA